MFEVQKKVVSSLFNMACSYPSLIVVWIVSVQSNERAWCTLAVDLRQDWHALLEKISWAEKAPIFQAGLPNPFTEQEDHLVPAIYCTQRPDTAWGSRETTWIDRLRLPSAWEAQVRVSLRCRCENEGMRFRWH